MMKKSQKNKGNKFENKVQKTISSEGVNSPSLRVCLNCNKKIKKSSNRCKSCSKKGNKSMLGKKHSKKSKLKISNKIKKLWKNLEYRNKIEAPFKGKKHTEMTKNKIRQTNLGKNNKKTKVKHHIYLIQNGNETINCTLSKHTQIHFRAYDYLVEKYSKKEIDKYLKWFDKKYSLK